VFSLVPEGRVATLNLLSFRVLSWEASRETLFKYMCVTTLQTRDRHSCYMSVRRLNEEE
jgi:hypothetical protein